MKGWREEDLHQYIRDAQRHVAQQAGLPEAGAPKTAKEALSFLQIAISTLLYEEILGESSRPPPATRKAMRVALLTRALQAWCFLAGRQLEVKKRTYDAGRQPKQAAAKRKAKVVARYDELIATSPIASKSEIRKMVAREFQLRDRTLRQYLSSR